jgi:hypothetical protein
MAPHHIEELRECEFGSWEDHQSGAETFEAVSEPAEGDTARYGSVHAYDILGRHRGKIEMRDADEVAEIYYSAASGTFQIDRTDEDEATGERGVGNRQFRAAQRLCDALRPVLQEPRYAGVYDDLLRVWPAPSGL